MKRAATIFFVVLPILLCLALAILCAVAGKRNAGWHMLPFDAAKTLVALSKGRHWHAIDILAAVGFYGGGAGILTAYVWGSLSALKKKSPLMAIGVSSMFIMFIEGWALLITIPTLVVPTG